MKLPDHAPVMILPEATLFPRAMLPLFIFEPRYRRMLADTLAGGRMFAVAMLKRAGGTRETPAAVAGLGVIRTAVQHPDGTSHLILEGVARVKLARPVSYKPYRTYRLQPLEAPQADPDTVDALTFRVRELAVERLNKSFKMKPPLLEQIAAAGASVTKNSLAVESFRHFIRQLSDTKDPGRLADMISCALLPRHAERQAILETVPVDERLMKLIEFLIMEIHLRPKKENEDE